MEEESNIIVERAQEDVETSNILLNNKNNYVCLSLGSYRSIMYWNSYV